jgi:hypothetical protein
MSSSPRAIASAPATRASISATVHGVVRALASLRTWATSAGVMEVPELPKALRM